jgi:hypothetical protein
MYDPKDIINLIADNVRKTKNPFGIPRFAVNNWWKKNNVPRQGDALLFTGLMYQFVPYIEKSTFYLTRFEDTPWADYPQVRQIHSQAVVRIGSRGDHPRERKKEIQRNPDGYCHILKKSKVDFFYDPRLDDYSGVLLYDLGDQDSFVQHARYVAAKLKRNGIKKLITVDPHTTYALKILFPKYTGERFEVHTYFELLNLTSKNGHKKIALHDPCFYGRYLELSDVPVNVLSSVDIECAPVRSAGLFTNCCGGPAESISPKLSTAVGERRIAELEKSDDPIVAMCPICLGNLRKAGADVEDLSTVLARQAH